MESKINMSEEEGLASMQDIFKRGPAYVAMWDEYKELFGDKDLAEYRFLQADIAFCEDQIEQMKRDRETKKHSSNKDELTDAIMLFQERIRFYRERLETLQEQTQTEIALKPDYLNLFINEIALKPDYLNLFINEAAARRVLEAAIIVGLLDEEGNWAKRRRGDKGLVIQFWIAVSKPQFNLTKVQANRHEVRTTVIQQCKIVAKQFGVPKGIGNTTINQYAWKRDDSYIVRIMKHFDPLMPP